MGVSLCKQCGYRWHHPQRIPEYCPGCKSKNWDVEPEPEIEACGLGGGMCDQCGAQFITELMQDHFCPNCGSDKWDGGKAGAKLPPKAPPKKFVCLKCGHRWTAKPGKTPTKCPHWNRALKKKDCGSRQIKEVLE